MGWFRRKKKILIVEDEPDIAASMASRLEMEGFKTLTASNGQDGVQKTRAEKPDLLILDIMMPLLNGYDVLNLLKTDPATKSIPIIVLTALPHVEDAENAFQSGASDFLNKPYTNERLIKKVRKFIEP